MENLEDKTNIWKTRQWIAGHYVYSTSDQCLQRISRNKGICYDPITHETHPCKKEKCPLYYNPKDEE